ncbi:O-acetylhomoserine aminocarboxypropyltransferase/cysteine synthase family protein [Pontibacillus sp. HMF3514]|uniref:O-acetylhomoserine aminocarboxypropyltransferase/cysteine synthase family protein n=1 Tax=Pontibacillus sp. HMF3514 TaxID=2692425 RepID=UPI00131F748F|nr:O-acetylhomoserine aminocarboxypropyltransferase/cysteine synthase family protein [Pontibacillus sp. HMF3514]QHE50850.1 aminotransferase class V-fold PLP-dependent enzyme [Pontibacillus sp. HMF3514]
MTTQQYNHETLSLHGGQTSDPTTGALAVPIYQTTSYAFENTQHAQDVFALEQPGNTYSRTGNPTVAAFEQRVSLLEDGAAAVATSSGMSAILLAILNVAEAGDEIITSNDLYGGTYNLFRHTLPKYGISVKFVDTNQASELREAITPNTKAVFSEIIGNPSLQVLDIELVADIAHEFQVPLIVDNTFASPIVCQPLRWGADIVIHSATKWIGGHGTTIGGIVVDGGRFNWDNSKFPSFTTIDETYKLRFADLGPVAYATRLRTRLLSDLGACLSPHSAFLFLQGLETLPIRIKKHSENAESIARYLNEHPQVDWVRYTGLEDHATHHLAQKYFKEGFGSIIVFGLKGGREEGKQLIDHVSLWSHVANVGDAKSLIIHPATTTHQQLSAEDLQKAGVSEQLIRLSVGLEDSDDLISDLDQAIAQATGTPSQDHSQNETQALASSIHRSSDGSIRRKTIATIDTPQNSLPDLTKLKRLGFEVIQATSLNDPKPIDILYAFSENELEQYSTTVETLQPTKIYLYTEGQGSSNVGLKTKTNVIGDLYQEAVRLRKEV